MVAEDRSCRSRTPGKRADRRVPREEGRRHIAVRPQELETGECPRTTGRHPFGDPEFMSETHLFCQRWMVLHANILRYYKDELAARSSASPFGEIPLAGCTLQFGKDRLFVLSFPSGRTFEMRCPDDRSHSSWKAKLEELGLRRPQAQAPSRPAVGGSKRVPSPRGMNLNSD